MHQQWPSRERPPNALYLLLQQQFVLSPRDVGSSSRMRNESYALNACAPQADPVDVVRETFASSSPHVAFKAPGAVERVVSFSPAPDIIVPASGAERARVTPAVPVAAGDGGGAPTRSLIVGRPFAVPPRGPVSLPRRASFTALSEPKPETHVLLRTPSEESDELLRRDGDGDRRERLSSPRQQRSHSSFFVRLFSRSRAAVPLRPVNALNVRSEIENDSQIALSSAHEWSCCFA